MQLDIELYQMLGLLLVCVGVFLWTQRNNKKPEDPEVGCSTNKDPYPENTQPWIVVYRKLIPKYYGLAGSHPVYCAKTVMDQEKPDISRFAEICAKESSTSGNRLNICYQFFSMRELGYTIHAGPMTLEEFESRWNIVDGVGLVVDDHLQINRDTRKQYLKVERRRPVL